MSHNRRLRPGRSKPIRFPQYVHLARQLQKSYRLKVDRSSRIGLEDLSRPADARQQPSHDSVVRRAAAALKLVLLDGTSGEGRGLICRLSLVLRKRHPLANDFPTRLAVFHVCGSLGCNFSTRPKATGSFTTSRNSGFGAYVLTKRQDRVLAAWYDSWVALARRVTCHSLLDGGKWWEYGIGLRGGASATLQSCDDSASRRESSPDAIENTALRYP
jgi:hypothetical protein